MKIKYINRDERIKSGMDLIKMKSYICNELLYNNIELPELYENIMSNYYWIKIGNPYKKYEFRLTEIFQTLSISNFTFDKELIINIIKLICKENGFKVDII